LRIKKWLKRWAPSPTFIVLVCVILFIFVWIYVINFTGYYGGRSAATAYNADREQIEAAVAVFMELPTNVSFNHTQGEVPIVNKSIVTVYSSSDAQWRRIPDEEYYVIAVFPMLTSSQPQGILKVAPPATAHPRNCFRSGANAEPNVTICAIEKLCHYFHNCSGSYVWLTTLNGDIASICIGENCANHNMDGYQGVYP
jgi:hypothetical protein